MIRLKWLYIPIALSALVALGLNVAKPAKADNVLLKQTRTITLCGDLFDINANADRLTAEERARIIQANLNNALIKTKDRSPKAVTIRVYNNLPNVELGGYHIATADTNSAIRANMTCMQLAEKWAASIKQCLADSETVEKYVSTLTTSTKSIEQAMVADRKHIAVIPSEFRMPIKLASKFYFDGTNVGENVTAVLSKDTPLGPQFDTYIPAGTLFHGAVVDAGIYSYNHFPNRNAVTIQFNCMETPDGQQIPIKGHIVGGVNQFEIAKKPSADAQGAVDLSSAKSIATKGLIAGAWVGDALPKDEQARLPRLFMNRGSVFDIMPEQDLELQTSATTSISVANSVASL